VGCADHDTIDRAAHHCGMVRQLCQSRHDACGDVGRRRALDRLYDLPVFQQHRVGVGAANIDADPSHGYALSANTER
jgi:hypothetical protein